MQITVAIFMLHLRNCFVWVWFCMCGYGKGMCTPLPLEYEETIHSEQKRPNLLRGGVKKSYRKTCFSFQPKVTAQELVQIFLVSGLSPSS